jgi:TolB-like protein
MPETTAKIQYEFNNFRLDPQQRLLLTGAEGRPIPLPPKVFDTLLYFVERRGELLDKTTLMKAIWPNIVVEENSLNQNISALRRVLGESPSEHRFIVTEPGRGYRFVADVRAVAASVPAKEAAQNKGWRPVESVTSNKAAARSSIAVLPFANLTGDPGKEYFSDGMAEELIHTLARIPGLRVPARTSSFAYKGRNTDVRQIARDLEVGAVLEGSVRSAGERIRVTAQLIDAESGYHIWSHNYDRKFDDIFELQDALAGEIVRALRESIAGDMGMMLGPVTPTRDVEAYHLYLQALYVTGQPMFQIPKGVEMLQRAIDRDPRFAGAYAGLASLRAVALVMDVPVPGTLAEAEAQARQALALDPSLGATCGALGIMSAAQGRWVDAEEQFASAFARDNADPQVRQAYGLHVAGTVGHMREFVESSQQAHRLAPAWMTGLFTLGVALILDGQTDEGQRVMNLATELGMPRLVGPVPDGLSLCLVRTGRFSEAASLMSDALPDAMRAAGGERVVHDVYAGIKDASQRRPAVDGLNRLRAQVSARETSEVFKRRLLVWYTCLGALDEAFVVANQSLDHFVESGTIGTAWGFLWMQELLPFRQDPRFQDFARRLRLFDYWNKFGPPDNCELRDGKLICR